MRDWSLWRVLGIALAYAALVVAATLLRFWLFARRKRAETGAGRVFWLIPYTRFQQWVAVLVGPPIVLLSLWLVVRAWATMD